MAVLVCPECDSPSINYNSQMGAEKGGPYTAPTEYTCGDCGHQFDDPAERKRHTEAPGLTGLAKKLDEMDPEDV